MTERDIFIAALQREDLAERRAYLDEACAGLPDLRRQVEDLLRLYAGAGSFLESPPAEPPATGPFPDAVEATSSPEVPGAVIGPYKLLEQLGEGGMGAVWMAQQTEPVRRLVAVKLIKPGMDNKAVLARFEAERQALALMDHPNIAKVLDAGMAPDGRPFFVMELVKGTTITKYCDQQRLTPLQRLELFVPVCHAIQHAHQKGIIHRDLKPSNVLVALYDDRPVPKVIDFGVAKATGQRLTEETLHTGFGAVVGTLEYMSPEQAGFNQLDIDTRSDIYSLGVLLYELLAGSPPFTRKELEKAGMLEMLRVIREQEPTKPSTKLSSSEALPTLSANRGTEPAKLTKLVRGELDWIVMKALEKDRGRRYETANSFAMDVQRYLAGEPVLAVPASQWYRLRKFVSRHKGRVVAAGLVFLVLLAGVVGTSWGLVRAEQANDQLAGKNKELADEQANRQARFKLAMKAIATFHTRLSQDMLLKNEQFKELRTNLLKEAAGFYDDLEKQLKNQTDTESRKLLGEGYFELGLLTESIGDKKAALAVHRQALAVRRELAAGGAVEAQLDVSKCLRAVAKLLLDLGDKAGALATYQEQQTLAAALEKDEPSDAVREELAASFNGIGVVKSETGKLAGALAAFQQAAVIDQRLADAHPDVTIYQTSLATCHMDIGLVQGGMGKSDEALATLEQARVILQRLTDAHPDEVQFQYDLSYCHSSIGSLLGRTGQSAKAGAAYERARDILKRLVEARPAVTKYQRDLAFNQNGIGLVFLETGHPAEALGAFRQVLADRKRLAEANPADIQFQSELAMSHYNLARLLQEMGKSGEARAAYEEVRPILKRLAREHPAPEYASTLGAVLNNLSSFDMEAKRFTQARDQLREAVTWQKQALAAEPTNPTCREFLKNHYLNLVRVADALGDRALAAEARRALAELAKNDPGTAALDQRLAGVLQGAAPKDNAERLGLAKRAYDTQRYALAARLWSEALQADPRLANDRDAQHRYNAACAAALAAAGQGRGEPAPDNAAQARLRTQALEWLEAELQTWSKLLGSANAEQRDAIAQILRHWKEDTDLAGLRATRPSGSMPDAQAQRVKALWARVDQLLTRAAAQDKRGE